MNQRRETYVRHPAYIMVKPFKRVLMIRAHQNTISWLMLDPLCRFGHKTVILHLLPLYVPWSVSETLSNKQQRNTMICSSFGSIEDTGQDHKRHIFHHPTGRSLCWKHPFLISMKYRPLNIWRVAVQKIERSWSPRHLSGRVEGFSNSDGYK